MIVDRRNLRSEVAKLVDKLMPNLTKINHSQALEHKSAEATTQA